MAQLWIVGTLDDAEEASSWNFVGVFDTEEAALAACTDECDFVGPVVLGVTYSDEPTPWPGAYRPWAGTQRGNTQ